MLPQPVVLVLDEEVLESVLMILWTELDDAELGVPVLLGDARIVLVSWVNILSKAREKPCIVLISDTIRCAQVHLDILKAFHLS